MTQQKNADTLGSTSNVFSSIAASLKEARQEVAVVPKARDEYHSKWQQASTLDDGKRSSMKWTVLELQELLAPARVSNALLETQYDLQLYDEKRRRNALKSVVNELSNKITKVEGLFCTLCAKKILVTAKVRALAS